jgi:hypothetical protein
VIIKVKLGNLSSNARRPGTLDKIAGQVSELVLANRPGSRIIIRRISLR